MPEDEKIEKEEPKSVLSEPKSAPSGSDSVGEEKMGPEEIINSIKPKKDKQPLGKKIKDWWATPKGKKQFLIGLGVFIILGAAGAVAYQRFGPEKSTVTNTTTKKKSALPKLEETKTATVASKLDGLQYAPDLANRAPLAIVVENHPDARPQYGLDKASMVFEALAEGGITRFLAVYGPQDVDRVGPIRSARTYFLDYAEGLQAFFAHVGGNIDALDRIPNEPIKDLDEFTYSGPYWRDNSRKVASEHTMYASTTKLYEVAKGKGWPMEAKFEGYTYKEDPAESQRPASQTVNVNISSAQYNLKYTYNPKENNYSRFLGGVAHKDAQTGEQLKIKNIVAIEVAKREMKTRINESGLAMTTTGSGKAKMFLDGKQIDGTWSKEKATAMLTFKDSTGSTVQFNRGNMWIEVTPDIGTASAQ